MRGVKHTKACTRFAIVMARMSLYWSPFDAHSNGTSICCAGLSPLQEVLAALEYEQGRTARVSSGFVRASLEVCPFEDVRICACARVHSFAILPVRVRALVCVRKRVASMVRCAV